MSRIVLISPFKDLTIAAMEVAKEQKIELEVFEGSMEGSREVIDRLKGQEIDVFISRGGTAAFIAAHYDVPVVSLDFGLYDVINSCEEARKLSRKIAITSYGKPIVGVGLLEKAMDVAIAEIIFRSMDDIEQQIAALALEDWYCVVGGGQSVQVAQKCGLPSVFLQTSKETIQAALIRAVETANLRREEKRKIYRLKAILESTYDGIIAVDSSGRVEIFNKAAEQIMGLDAGAIIGKTVREVLPTTRLHDVLKTGKMEIGAFLDIGSTRIVTNRVPVRDEREVMGAVATFQDSSRIIQVEHQLRREITKNHFKAKYRLEDIVGESPIMTDTKTMARSFANSDYTVLIYGASGCGKELFAQGIHNASKRVFKPFVAINCAALPPTLLESELFGHEEGAFTGAKRKGKLGLFELGHGGTVFLDEIDALPFDLQGRLLRVLQEKEVLRVGGETIIPVNIRVIAATNKPPHELVAANKMREDLYYRINVLYLELPRLKDRKDDIPLLCRRFLGSKFDVMEDVTREMMPFLQCYSWPGNVRELQNFCQRLAFYQENYLLHKNVDTLLHQLAPNILGDQDCDAEITDLVSRAQAYEIEMLQEAVREAGSIRRAAEKLGIGKSTLARKLKNKS